MPGEDAVGRGRPAASTAAEAAGRTRRALAGALDDRGSAAVLASSAALYVLVYLVAVGDLGRTAGGVVAGGGPLSATVASAPVRRALAGEAVALVTLGPVEALLSPATLATAAALGLLVGGNLALSALAWRRPAACGVSPASGLAAGLPALLSGTACCGPLLFVALGLQATSAALTAVAWLRPAAALLLVASLAWAAWRLDARPSAVRASGRGRPGA